VAFISIWQRGQMGKHLKAIGHESYQTLSRVISPSKAVKRMIPAFFLERAMN